MINHKNFNKTIFHYNSHSDALFFHACTSTGFSSRPSLGSRSTTGGSTPELRVVPLTNLTQMGELAGLPVAAVPIVELPTYQRLLAT